MSGNMKEDARFYEYGTRNKSGEAVDFSKRVNAPMVLVLFLMIGRF